MRRAPSSGVYTGRVLMAPADPADGRHATIGAILLERLKTFRTYFIGAATEIYALWLALRDPHAPWGARLLAVAFAFYVILPLDIIPEPLPLIGIADDLLAFPLAYFVISRMLPGQLMEVALRHARSTGAGERLWRVFLIVLALLSVIWLVALMGLGITIWRLFN